MAKLKPTAEQLQAEIKLQLSQRRFVLEAVQTGAQLLQVPLITAGIWYYLSSTNPTLGALNKAILTAELAPIVGDIKFPEGVLLGAAMESSEDMLSILDKAGLLDKEKIKEEAIKASQDTGDLLADQIVRIIPDQQCEYWLNQVNENQPTLGNKLFTGTEGAFTSAVAWFVALKKLKAQGCEQPRTISDTIWQRA